MNGQRQEMAQKEDEQAQTQETAQEDQAPEKEIEGRSVFHIDCVRKGRSRIPPFFIVQIITNCLFIKLFSSILIFDLLSFI